MQDNKLVKLKSIELPKMVGELWHSNQFLKIFAIAALAITFMMMSLVIAVVTKDPTVITLDNNGREVSSAELPRPEDQIREGIKRYLEKRYQWQPDDVVKKLKESENFISQKALKAFQVAVANVAKFSVDKVVSQKVYPEKIDINLNRQTALITGDRVTSIQGLKAAGNLKLELTF